MPNSIPPITTSRLLLRALEEEDAPYIFALRASPEVNRYLDRKAATDVSEAYEFIQKIRAHIMTCNRQKALQLNRI